MSGFSSARNDGPSAASASPGFTVKAKTTAKARHKDDRARVTAHALAAGRTGKVREDRPEDLNESVATMVRDQQVPVVPRHEGEPGEAREHVRRDIGSHVAVFELGAPDNPEDLSAPFTDPQGVKMRWAVRCLTHEETRYLAEHRRALQSVKASHTWCSGCAAALAGSRRIHNRARAQKKKAT